MNLQQQKNQTFNPRKFGYFCLFRGFLLFLVGFYLEKRFERKMGRIRA
jgi:uncharacterized membrane protein YiaA